MNSIADDVTDGMMRPIPLPKNIMHAVKGYFFYLYTVKIKKQFQSKLIIISHG